MNRRNILRAMAAGTAIGVGINPVSGAEHSSSGSTNEEGIGPADHDAIRSKYDSKEEIVNALEEHSSDLLSALAREDLIGTAEPKELASLSNSVEKSSDELSVSSSLDHKTDELTAVIELTEEFEEGETSIYVLPEAERSYATVEYDSGRKVLKSPDDSATADDDDDASIECVYHDIHDWELVGTEIECDYDDWCDYDTSCADACAEDYYTQNTYEVYECQAVDYCPSGEIECSATKTELVNSTCSNDCCQDNGVCIGGCGC